MHTACQFTVEKKTPKKNPTLHRTCSQNAMNMSCQLAGDKNTATEKGEHCELTCSSLKRFPRLPPTILPDVLGWYSPVPPPRPTGLPSTSASLPPPLATVKLVPPSTLSAGAPKPFVAVGAPLRDAGRPLMPAKAPCLVLLCRPAFTTAGARRIRSP